MLSHCFRFFFYFTLAGHRDIGDWLERNSRTPFSFEILTHYFRCFIFRSRGHRDIEWLAKAKIESAFFSFSIESLFSFFRLFFLLAGHWDIWRLVSSKLKTHLHEFSKYLIQGFFQRDELNDRPPSCSFIHNTRISRNLIYMTAYIKFTLCER